MPLVSLHDRGLHVLPRAVLAGVMLDLRRMVAARAGHADHGEEQQTSHIRSRMTRRSSAICHVDDRGRASHEK